MTAQNQCCLKDNIVIVLPAGMGLLELAPSLFHMPQQNMSCLSHPLACCIKCSVCKDVAQVEKNASEAETQGTVDADRPANLKDTPCGRRC